MYLLLAAVTLWFIRRLGSVLMTAAVAYGLAYLVNPALTWLEGRGVRRVVGMLLVTLIGLMVLGLFSWVVTAQLVNLLNDLPQFITQLGTAVGDLLERLSGVPGLEHVQENFAVSLNEQARQLSTNLGPTIQRLLASGGTLLGGAASLASWFGQAAFVLILSLYFMLGYQRVGAGVLRVIPRSWRPTVQTLSEDVSVSFGGYLRGQLLIGLAVGLLIALGLSLLGIPNALAIGLLAALLNIVPYLGPVVAAVPALLPAVPGGWITVLLVTAVFVAAKADAEGWVHAGRACQRFALLATALGLKHAFLNQPVEVAALRSDLAALLVMPGRRPDLVMRFGRAAAMPFSARRPVDTVMV